MSKNEVLNKKEKPLYFGHRWRLRKRFLIDLGTSMLDYEMLELLLTMSIPRRDVKPLAKRLIAKYKDLSGVIDAQIEELKEFSGLSTTTAVLLKIVKESIRRACCPKLETRDEEQISNWIDLATLAREQIVADNESAIYAFYFNSNPNYIGKLKICEQLNSDIIDKKKLVMGLYEFNASVVAIIYSNHENIPLSEEKEFTACQKLEYYLSLFGTKLLDYQILEKEQTISFSHFGLLKSNK